MTTATSCYEGVLKRQVEELKDEVLELKIKNLGQLGEINRLKAELAQQTGQSRAAA